MSSQDILTSAARGLSSHVGWQLVSRCASFVIKAVAIRAMGPSHFAFSEIRLGVLNAAALPVALGIRKIALRAPNEIVSRYLVVVGSHATAAVAAVLGLVYSYNDMENAGSIILTAISSSVEGYAEHGLVFYTRREGYAQVARGRAVATICGSIATTISICILPVGLRGSHASAIGRLVYSMVLKLMMDRAMTNDQPPMCVRDARVHLKRNDLEMAGIASCQTTFKFFLENGEAMILDMVCKDPIKGAYKLAANIGSLLARIFNEALEEQSFNTFSRIICSHARTSSNVVQNTTREGSSDNDIVERNVLDGGDSLSRKLAWSADGAAANDRCVERECVHVLVVGLKCSLLVSLLIAFVGPSFSYAFIRLMYGAGWADDTPTAALLGTYFIYLIFMAANGVTEALVAASASATTLRRQSMFSVLLSCLYMMLLLFAGRSFSARGIMAANCANMAARIVYSCAYICSFGDISWGQYFAALPRVQVVISLCVGRWLCRLSESFWCMDGRKPVSGRSLLVNVAGHSVSGVISVILFATAVTVFEKELISFVRSSFSPPRAAANERSHID